MDALSRTKNKTALSFSSFKVSLKFEPGENDQANEEEIGNVFSDCWVTHSNHRRQIVSHRRCRRICFNESDQTLFGEEIELGSFNIFPHEK